MPDKNEERDQETDPSAQPDTEGHSMFLYEAGRQMARQREIDVQRHAREARMLKERQSEKKR